MIWVICLLWAARWAGRHTGGQWLKKEQAISRALAVSGVLLLVLLVVAVLFLASASASYAAAEAAGDVGTAAYYDVWHQWLLGIVTVLAVL